MYILFKVYIASIGADLIQERMRIATVLWKSNISAEYSHKDNPKFKPQLDEVLERGIPFMVVFGSDELSRGVVKLKNMKVHTEVELSTADLVDTLLGVDYNCRAISAGVELEFLQSMQA